MQVRKREFLCEVAPERFFGQIEVFSQHQAWCGVYKIKANRFVLEPPTREKEVFLFFDDFQQRWCFHCANETLFKSPFLFGAWQQSLFIQPLRTKKPVKSFSETWLPFLFVFFWCVWLVSPK